MVYCVMEFQECYEYVEKSWTMILWSLQKIGGLQTQKEALEKGRRKNNLFAMP